MEHSEESSVTEGIAAQLQCHLCSHPAFVSRRHSRNLLLHHWRSAVELHGWVAGGWSRMQACENISNVCAVFIDERACAHWHRPLGGCEVSDEVEITQHVEISCKMTRIHRKIISHSILFSSLQVLVYVISFVLSLPQVSQSIDCVYSVLKNKKTFTLHTDSPNRNYMITMPPAALATENNNCSVTQAYCQDWYLAKLKSFEAFLNKLFIATPRPKEIVIHLKLLRYYRTEMMQCCAESTSCEKSSSISSELLL